MEHLDPLGPTVYPVGPDRGDPAVHRMGITIQQGDNLMKKMIGLIIASATMACAFCQYMSKSGEYTSNRTFNNGSVYSTKVCVYGDGDYHIPVAYFNQYYCPYSIEYDRYRNRICDWN